MIEEVNADCALIIIPATEGQHGYGYGFGTKYKTWNDAHRQAVEWVESWLQQAKDQVEYMEAELQKTKDQMRR